MTTPSFGDTGTFTDTAFPTTPWVGTDPWGGADPWLGPDSAHPLTETGTGTDVLTVTATVPLAETGTGTGALTVSVPIALAQTATGTDALAVGGGGVADPSTIASLYLRYVASDLALSNGATVTSWAPRTGSGTLTVAGTTTYQASSLVGSRPAVRFNGTSSTAAATATAAGGTAITVVMIICCAVTPTAQQMIVQLGGSVPQYLIAFSVTPFWQEWSTTGLTASSVHPDASPHVVAMAADSGATDYIVLDGTSIASGESGTPASSTGLQIGWDGSSSFFRGDIAEVLFFNTKLTTSDLAVVDSYAQVTYGITVSDFNAPLAETGTFTDALTVATVVGLATTPSTAQSHTAATSLAVPFTTPTANNLLVLLVGVDKASGGGGTISGWTKLIDQSGASVSHLVYYKLATGSETTVTATWATSAPSGASAIVAEYSGVNQTTPVTTANTTTYSDTTVTSIAVDPPAAGGAGGAALGVFAMDSNTLAGTGTWRMTASGWTVDSSAGLGSSDGNPSCCLAHFAGTLTGGQDLASTTFTSNAGTDQIGGSSFVVNAAGTTTPVSLAETGTGTNALTVTALVTLAESGTGTDAISAGAPITLTGETGSLTDALTVTLRVIPLPETGAGTDAVTVTARVTLAESGTGTDAISAGAPIAVADTGSLTDALTVTLRLVALAESGSLTDSMFATGPAVIAVGGVILASSGIGLATLASPGGGVATLTSSGAALATLASSGAGLATVASSDDGEAVLASSGAGIATVQT